MPRTAPVVLAAVLLVPAVASAQPAPPGGPIQRPVFSPYLNLLNRGGSPALNYFGIVQPQMQMMQQFGQLQQQANLTNQALNQATAAQADLLNSFLSPTGNVAVFNYTGGYFNRYGGGGYGGVGGFGAGGFNRFGGPGGANISNRPSFAGGYGAGGLARPPVGGLRR